MPRGQEKKERDRHYKRGRMLRADEWFWDYLEARKRRTGVDVNSQIVELVRRQAALDRAARTA